jgi:hypothetical protein
VPLMRRSFNKKAFVEAFSVQRLTGLGQYKINTSALKRFVLSCMDAETAQLQPGDKLITYDWFQPNAIMLLIGANIDEGGRNAERSEDISKSIGWALAEGVASRCEHPGRISPGFSNSVMRAMRSMENR